MSNWKVSIKEVNDFDQEIKREAASIKEALHKVQTNMDEIINMEQFQGEAADAAKEYFQVLHETLLQAFIGVFEQLEANITKHLQAFSDEVDSSSQAIIQADYLDSEEHDILDIYRQLEHVQRDVERIIDSVSDLTTAQSPSTYHPLESKENSIRVMSKLSRKLSSYSHSFSSDNQQLESSLHEIKVLMDKVAKQTNKHAITNDFQASLPFITSFVSDAIEQAPFERMLLTQEDRDRQSILASRHSRESRQLVGLRKYEKATFADSQLEERIQTFFRARLRQNLLQANRWWQETVTQQINVTNRYLLQTGIAYTDYLSNVKTTGKDILNDAIVEPVTKSWDSAKIIGKSIADSAQERNEKKYESGYDFANYATFGIPSAVLGIKEGFDQRYQALQDDESVSTFLNYATMGTTEMTVNAVNPEEAYSPEHWLNSFGLATLIASGGLSAASNQILTKPTWTQPKPAVTIPKSQKTTKTQLIPFRTDYIKGKMDKALEQIGKVKVPVLVKEELATEFGSLSMLRMETKRLQETQLQWFKGRGNKGICELSEIVKQGQKMPKHIEVKNKTNLPGKGEPNSSADLLNPDGTVKQRRYYDENGRAKEDIDFNHSDDGTHTFPHRHKWDWSKKPPRQKPE
ncbi:T7SS effector LXG polymorphic toxin [Gracilibacillus suaedae]|uniref:T7SS effector LXG polymorphic toxin n=1 Tax=Gracilibacillus suaedae TaxID=2820273 RepID=UPI001ABEE26F|nr:T7SS effector LXG polymorphic toxin [Gracilibacillus suaedae]